MSTPQVVPMFLPGSAGQLFALYFNPVVPRAPQTAVLYCPPFAEEMNKARRMAALQARRLAQEGCGVLLLDLYGSGDSAGDFGAATWVQWRDDVRCALQWLLKQGVERVTLWGLRLGCALALETAAEFPAIVDRVILWHPVVRGEQMITQFLRLRLAADLMGGEEKITTHDLRAALYRGEAQEIAGYLLHPELVKAIDAIDLKSHRVPPQVSLEWFEMTSNVERGLTPAARGVVDAWRAAGLTVNTHSVAGSAFWSAIEIEVVPELIDRSAAVFNGVLS